jgi:hypothetical protein
MNLLPPHAGYKIRSSSERKGADTENRKRILGYERTNRSEENGLRNIIPSRGRFTRTEIFGGITIERTDRRWREVRRICECLM